MARELYGAQGENERRDPLRMAEEFRAGLGDAALADFLRRRIRDDAFEPGLIHRDLLDLPWADVLTTNYDTLLERAAQHARRGYDLVLTESDLPHAGGPRIIKLHGSLRDGADVVISEEDYAHLFGPDAGADPGDLVMATRGRTPHIQPNEADAVRLFLNVAGWRPEKPAPESLREAFARPAREERGRMMASVLGIVAAPALAKGDRTVERAEAALTFLKETDLPESLSALPVFYGLNEDIDRRIENAFRRPIAIGDRHATPAAVDALDHWLRLSKSDQSAPLPDVLRDLALRSLERGRTGGLANLIYLARRILEAGRCGIPERDRIAEVLDELRGATDYGPPDGDADIETDRAVCLPLVRAECVRLARTLERQGVTTEPVHAWRDLAARDPLPEVRNAACDVADL